MNSRKNPAGIDVFSVSQLEIYNSLTDYIKDNCFLEVSNLFNIFNNS